MVETCWSINALAALTKLYARRTGNNPADLRQIDAEFLNEAADIDLGSSHHDLILLSGAGGLDGAHLIEAWNPLGVDLDSDFAGRGDVREVRDESI